VPLKGFDMSEAASNKLDSVKWLLVVALLGAGIVGNSYFSDESLLYRVIAILVIAGIALSISVTTRRGAAAWAMIKGARTEIRKVIWPTRQETTQTTVIVMVAVVVCGLFFWALDSFLGWVASLLLG
jgi:preprotein translocase subunit SecE